MSDMRYLFAVLLALVISAANLQTADAQQQQQQQQQTNAAGNVSGQTGQSDNFNIQRDTTSFIGGSAANFLGGQAGAGGTGLGGLGGFGGGIGGLGGFGRGNTGLGTQANTQSTTAPQIRFRITLGFSHPRPAGTKVSADFARRLTRIPQIASARSVAVTMEDRTAVLAGEVETEHERMLIEKLAMMEPGVSAVRNELTVAAALELLPLPESTN
jgi:hypothetical protein